MEKPTISDKPVIDFKFGRVGSKHKDKKIEAVAGTEAQTKPAPVLEETVPATSVEPPAPTPAEPPVPAEDPDLEKIVSLLADNADSLLGKISAGATLSASQKERLQGVANKLSL